jgi:hypothetical protein
LNKTGGFDPSKLSKLKAFAKIAAEKGSVIAKKGAEIAKKGIEKAEKLKNKCYEMLTPIVEELNREKETYSVLFNLAVHDENVSYDKILKYVTRIHVIMGMKIAEISSKKNLKELVSIMADIRCIVLKINVKKLRKKSHGLASMISQLKELLNKVMELIKLVYSDGSADDEDIDFDCNKK